MKIVNKIYGSSSWKYFKDNSPTFSDLPNTTSQSWLGKWNTHFPRNTFISTSDLKWWRHRSRSLMSINFLPLIKSTYRPVVVPIIAKDWVLEEAINRLLLIGNKADRQRAKSVETPKESVAAPTNWIGYLHITWTRMAWLTFARRTTIMLLQRVTWLQLLLFY